MVYIFVDNARCDGCMLCLAACNRDGLMLTDSGITHDRSCDCLDCRKCEYICARGAITWGYEVTEAGCRNIK
ncbi:MAG: ferredoxin [Dehalogenimonas sp.]|uniref:Ferredoxin n=1 Tax=Candidatus Dehalogenimonas loeffleri TaxID=3127115 RepID=A0ABZ2J2J3_9CHLR|nr:ferredoxin [Dehalogenimonas sp.]